MIKLNVYIILTIDIASFGGIIAPFFFIDTLGIITSILFSLASLCLFYVFAIIPHRTQGELSIWKDRYAGLPLHFQHKKEKVDKHAYEDSEYWLGASLILFVIGILCLLIHHSLL